MSKQSLHLFTPVEIAEELTLRDAELLRRIGATEIRNGAWMDKQVCLFDVNRRFTMRKRCTVLVAFEL